MCNDPTELTIIRWCFQARFDTSPRAALPELMDFTRALSRLAIPYLSGCRETSRSPGSNFVGRDRRQFRDEQSFSLCQGR